MPKNTAKERLQQKLQDKSECPFKSIYSNILKKDKEPELLLQDIRNVTNKDAYLIKQINSKILQFISLNYIKLLNDNKQFVNQDDIKTLSTHIKNTWNSSPAYLTKSNKFIGEIRGDVIDSKLPFHDHKSREGLLITINDCFAPQVSLDAHCSEIIYLVGIGFLEAAYLQYNKFKHEINNKEPFTLGRIFANACKLSAKKGSVDYLDQFIEQFDINLKTLTIKYKNVTCTPMVFFLAQEAAIKEKYIALLCNKHGLHPDSDTQRVDFAEFENMTPLMLAGYRGDPDSIKLLLKYGAKINLVTSFEGNSDVSLHRTAFSVSIGTKDIDIINLLIDNGADPTITSNLFSKDMEAMLGKKLPSNLHLMPIISRDGNFNSPDNHEYLAKIHAIVERHHIKKILSSLEFNAKASEHKEANDSAVKPESTTEELLDNYIGFKQESLAIEKSIAQDSKVNIEDQFDLILLQYCRNKSDAGLNEIDQYIQKNPELNLYALTSILNIPAPEEVAHQIFSNKPKLLNKFFTLKKSITSAEYKDVAATPLKDMYIVQSNFKNNIYVTVDPELKKTKEYSNIAKKASSVLESCKYIKSDSKDISGIKTYGGVIKLKLAGKDLSLYTNQKYLETSTGNVFIVFDKIGDHKLKNDSKLVTTIEVENFTAVWKDLNYETVTESLENFDLSSDHPNVASETDLAGANDAIEE